MIFTKGTYVLVSLLTGLGLILKSTRLSFQTICNWSHNCISISPYVPKLPPGREESGSLTI